MIFALRRDVIPVPGIKLNQHSKLQDIEAPALVPGQVQLRPDKRPRPLVLRMNVGDCLQINFQNLLAPDPPPGEVGFDDQPATRTASVHVIGMQLVGSIASDGSFVGQNASSVVAPGGTATYTYYAEREGAHLFYNGASTTGGEGDGGSLDSGLFGVVNVEPREAVWYRSQVTQQEMAWATTGMTADGHPIINYDAVYPDGPFAGKPILRILDGTSTFHSDIYAIIVPALGTYKDTPINPNRNQPFREFTIVYHDEIGAKQAFSIFEDPVFKEPLSPVRDGFAHNYGAAGIGSMVLANRLDVGPVWDCPECKYEEFFLSSWAMGDPAMVVDVPANTTDAAVDTGGLPISPTGFPHDVTLPNQANVLQNDAGCLSGKDCAANFFPEPPTVTAAGSITGTLIKGPKATKAFFPDDPSNVFHSYINDHVKQRIVHGGAKEHHIHHLHAHQWAHTPDSDNSSYLDSQAIGPGSSFTLEITYNGTGNRNKVVGDSIFHCHFYPHFAQGMWSLWRSHDVFEAGTVLDADGRPALGPNRVLPDGEIMAGTSIPALVPLPGMPMAPMPEATVQIKLDAGGNPTGQIEVIGGGNPGYPFFIPAAAGHRPPHPPLDTIDDGGLPRHIITAGTFMEKHTRLDFSKTLISAQAVQLPEEGTDVEKAAMDFHNKMKFHNTFFPDGSPANGTSGFRTNGSGASQPGAPYADPCVKDDGTPTGNSRLYKAADIQLDVTVNKAGWHTPQHRMITLWGDVLSTLEGTKPPEPFFFRANTNDCITYYLTNLVPSIYEQDDFQVRTPTDVLGQHIHLVKFDVTSSDGSGNGWNYEDGTFSPDEVIERINAINTAGGLTPVAGGIPIILAPKPHPFFGTPGAQTTVQRWYADETLNNAGKDRTLRTVFTHDHFGPSTHQQAGLYAGLVIEPNGSTWRNPETGATLGGRFDGGPTSWHADILTANAADSYREFLLEYDDHRPAYTASGAPINVMNRDEELAFGLTPKPCPDGPPLGCPMAISAHDTGIMTVNYRSEPLGLRVRDPNLSQLVTLEEGMTVSTNGMQAAGAAGDLSNVFRSDILRADPAFNLQPGIYPPLTPGVQPGDPFTPLLRTYENDKVQVRILVGATEEGHNFSINGVKWLFEPSDPNSGYRNSQMSGISEHFEFLIPTIAPVKGPLPFADYVYKAGSSVDDLWNGMWGILRAYDGELGLLPDLKPLPNNLLGMSPPNNLNAKKFRGVCPTNAPIRKFDITAITAQQAIGGPLVYSLRTNYGGALIDPTAILYVRTTDLDSTGTKLKPGVPIEPLILRANAGDCALVKLSNKLPATLPDLMGWSTMPPIIDFFNANQIAPSNQVGLHPQLVTYDISNSDGQNAGFNPVQTAVPGGTITYLWYAGNISVDQSTGIKTAVPVEFGAVNLMPSDPIKHTNKGLIGALVIEPPGGCPAPSGNAPNQPCWEDTASRASATIFGPTATNKFRDFVLLFQNDINLRYGDGSVVPNVAREEDAEDSGHKALNYRTEPMWKRMNYEPDLPLSGGHGVPGGPPPGSGPSGFSSTREIDFTKALSNGQVGGDPVTPLFTAKAGMPVRFRVLHPGGHQRNNVFSIHGHVWEEEPYINNSTAIGDNPLSEWKGAQMGHGPSNHFDAIPAHGAGGAFAVPGDYLYRDMASFQFDGGLWGIFRVMP